MRTSDSSRCEINVISPMNKHVQRRGGGRKADCVDCVDCVDFCPYLLCIEASIIMESAAKIRKIPGTSLQTSPEIRFTPR
jgi:predicted aldo/keto reductase-like oxidoreductase